VDVGWFDKFGSDVELKLPDGSAVVVVVFDDADSVVDSDSVVDVVDVVVDVVAAVAADAVVVVGREPEVEDDRGERAVVGEANGDAVAVVPEVETEF